MAEQEDYLSFRPSAFLEFYFIHYENAGELISKYKYEPLIVYNEASSSWVSIPEDASHLDYETYNPLYFPKFFDQDTARIRPIRYNTAPDTNFLSATTRWLDDINYAPFIRIYHKANIDGTTSILDFDRREIIYDIDIYFGEYYLLSNNYKTIKRFNIKTELLQNDKNSTAFQNLRGEFSYPDETIVGKESSYLEWSFGYAPIPPDQRPDHLYAPRIAPTIYEPVHTESRRPWKSVRETCLSWFRVYDKTNINKQLFDRTISPDSTVCTTKCTISHSKLKNYLDETFDFSSYTNREAYYDIIMYPPSMYLYPSNSVIKIVEPEVNTVNKFTDVIIFEAPKNFKTDGNLHYRIDFYGFSTTQEAIFKTSSFIEDEGHEPRNWYFSKDDMKTWEYITENRPTFDNGFDDDNGSDGIFTTHIKYALSRDIFNMVKNTPTIIFKIYQIDGTLVHLFKTSRFTLSYHNELT
ncbi:MAG: hypothetical protein DRQ78_00020 [Epsilonproteobacteria bacterium]|nr:MAG: hypothetical protein DRQ78_00020 [Campylobacterota bacterium]